MAMIRGIDSQGSRRIWIFGLLAVWACVVGGDALGTSKAVSANNTLGNNFPLVNPLGVSTTWSTAGEVDLGNPFFQEFGTNGRQCGHCHKPAEGWTVSAANVRNVFARTGGLDPIFRTNDGSNSPIADVSTEAARRSAYSMLLNRGVIRVGIGIPAGGEFELVAVDDPYGFASAAELSLFRRPLPSANLTLIPVVMWDGRVTASMPPGSTVNDALAAQANAATLGHAAAGAPLTDEARQAIVAFETGLFNAQTVAHDLGSLSAECADGGAKTLADAPRLAGPFNLFDSWVNSNNEARRAAFRGQELFNTRTRQNGVGMCRTCHSVANSGTNANGTFFTVNTSDGDRRALDQPLYTIRRTACPASGCGTAPIGTTITTTDPGRALITGAWTDMNRFKVPSLRALGARAPYFHGGSANTLQDVVNHYMSLPVNPFVFTVEEQADLVAFLSAL